MLGSCRLLDTYPAISEGVHNVEQSITRGLVRRACSYRTDIPKTRENEAPLRSRPILAYRFADRFPDTRVLDVLFAIGEV